MMKRLNDILIHKGEALTLFAATEQASDDCLKLDLASERGHTRDDVRAGLRIAGFTHRVTVAFTVDHSTVTILRLFYGGQDWEGAFEE